MFSKLPKHITRLLLLLGAAIILAYGAVVVMTDPSFYEYGHYRADAVPELAEGEPVYKGSANCRECHEQRNSDWLTGAHKTVQCEVCHLADFECPDTEGARIPKDTIRLCTTCHEKMPARPASHPQIVPEEHPFDDGQIMHCSECHNPHAPGPVLREEDLPAPPPAEVAFEPAVPMPESASRCAKCHGKLGEGVGQFPALAGMESTVFTEKMRMYQSGASDSKIMIRFAKALSDEELAELAEYYEALPANPPNDAESTE